MKVLIISVWFDDDSLIGAVRPRNFAFWLAQLGHEVTVLTRKPRSGVAEIDPPGVRVLRVAPLSLLQILRRKWGSSSMKAKEEAPAEERRPSHSGGIPATNRNSAAVMGAIKLFSRHVNRVLWAIAATRKLLRHERPDVLFATFGPLEPHFVARWYSWRTAGTPWIADFRDLMVQQEYNWPTRRFLAVVQRSMVRAADAVTCVSRGLAEELERDTEPRRARPVHLIPNGYNPAETSVLSDGEVADGVLRIAYTGNMYRGRRDATALFQALASLIRDGELEAEHVQVHYAGGEGPVFRSQAEVFGMENLVVDHGLVSRSAALALQSRSDILVVLSWNTTGERGILTGKIYDYLAAGRPVLTLTGGDLAGAELTQLVESLEAGYAFEYVRAAAHGEGLRNFLLDAYRCRRAGRRLSVQPNELLGEYQYDKITRRLEQIAVDLVEARSRRR